MGSNLLLIWVIQGIIALCQGRVLYLYSITSGQHDIRRTILTIALLYASAAVSMVILLLVFHGKRDLRITRHAFWTTILFPVIATVIADILYIKVTGRFFLGLFLFIFAAVIYIVAGLGLPMLFIRIFGHSSFQPFIDGRRSPVKSGYSSHGFVGRKVDGIKNRSNRERGTYQTGASNSRRVIIPDYQQEYIDKVSRDYLDRFEQDHREHLNLVNNDKRPVYSGGTRTQTKVAYVNQDNQIIRCDESRYGYGRLGRIASSGEIYEYSGGSEVFAGYVTAAGYIRNAAGLDIGCVDDEGNVFRYEGDGALDMTHAKTLVGKVNQGDYAAGAAFLLLCEKP